MGVLFTALVILSSSYVILWADASNKKVSSWSKFNVLDYGAYGDGQRDDSQVFSKAWQAACSAETHASRLVIPNKRFLIYPGVTFQGPCKAKAVVVKVSGTLLAPTNIGAWDKTGPNNWLRFYSVDNLEIRGWGIINGQGESWWENSCRINPKPGCTKVAPTALDIQSCNNSVLKNLHFLNSPFFHVNLNGCENVRVHNLRINAPSDSPNTDGVHVANSRRVQIEGLNIGTGDDCISIGDNTYDLDIGHINCGPGHGISVGSLGRNGGEATVEGILIRKVNFSQTTNGARIKTWQGGKGYVKNISFVDMTFDRVQNPIIIDQYYCETPNQCSNHTSAVGISNVKYIGSWGTSSSEVAVNLKCSETMACTGIEIQNMELTPSLEGINSTKAYCLNAHGSADGTVVPSIDCLA